jgi:hypothetical protein
MQLRYSNNHNFAPNETWALPDFTMEHSRPYLLIVGAEYASSACYIGIVSITASIQELALHNNNIAAHVSSSGTLEISYNPPEGIGAQFLYINIIRLS